MKKDSLIYVTGHNGMVGSAILRSLNKNGYKNLLLKSSNEVNLINQNDVNKLFLMEKPEYVIDAAAKVGGILANNTYRGEFIYENLMIQNNLIHAAHEQKVKKLLFLGSSCIYPKFASQPIKEEYLLTGELEKTNEPYAIAKISGIKMCENYFHQYGDNYFSVMPTNLYGPKDNYDVTSSHVIPALIRRFHEAKEHEDEFVKVWGTGTPKREFLYVDDLADACIFVINNLNGDTLYKMMNITHLNIGYGEDLTISELAELIAKIVGYKGSIEFDHSKPDGTPRKLLDVTRIKNLGCEPKIKLKDGIKLSYNWFIKNYKN